MLIVSPEFKCSNEILTITAMLSGIVILRLYPLSTSDASDLYSAQCMAPTK